MYTLAFELSIDSPTFHFSGRELFLSDSSLFVDDAEAYEEYQREEERDDSEKKVLVPFLFLRWLQLLLYVHGQRESICFKHDVLPLFYPFKQDDTGGG